MEIDEKYIEDNEDLSEEVDDLEVQLAKKIKRPRNTMSGKEKEHNGRANEPEEEQKAESREELTGENIQEKGFKARTVGRPRKKNHDEKSQQKKKITELETKYISNENQKQLKKTDTEMEKSEKEKEGGIGKNGSYVDQKEESNVDQNKQENETHTTFTNGSQQIEELNTGMRKHDDEIIRIINKNYSKEHTKEEFNKRLPDEKRSREKILPEATCSLHPPLCLGSKHFKLTLPRPEDAGYHMLDSKGTYRLAPYNKHSIVNQAEESYTNHIGDKIIETKRKREADKVIEKEPKKQKNDNKFLPIKPAKKEGHENSKIQKNYDDDVYAFETDGSKDLNLGQYSPRKLSSSNHSNRESGHVDIKQELGKTCEEEKTTLKSMKRSKDSEKMGKVIEKLSTTKSKKRHGFAVDQGLYDKEKEPEKSNIKKRKGEEDVNILKRTNVKTGRNCEESKSITPTENYEQVIEKPSKSKLKKGYDWVLEYVPVQKEAQPAFHLELIESSGKTRRQQRALKTVGNISGSLENQKRNTDYKETKKEISNDRSHKIEKRNIALPNKEIKLGKNKRDNSLVLTIQDGNLDSDDILDYAKVTDNPKFEPDDDGNSSNEENKRKTSRSLKVQSEEQTIEMPTSKVPDTKVTKINKTADDAAAAVTAAPLDKLKPKIMGSKGKKILKTKKDKIKDKSDSDNLWGTIMVGLDEVGIAMGVKSTPTKTASASTTPTKALVQVKGRRLSFEATLERLQDTSVTVLKEKRKQKKNIAKASPKLNKKPATVVSQCTESDFESSMPKEFDTNVFFSPSNSLSSSSGVLNSVTNTGSSVSSAPPSPDSLSSQNYNSRNDDLHFCFEVSIQLLHT